MIPRISLLTVFVVTLASVMIAQNSGHLSGTVLDENGAVVEHAHLCISVRSGNTETTNCRYPVDNEGHFEVQNVEFGSYIIFAINEDKGYSIENQSPGLKITLTPENPSQTVTVHSRPAGAILTRSVTDKFSGKASAGRRVAWAAGRACRLQ